jgi:hypothetical protein
MAGKEPEYGATTGAAVLEDAPPTTHTGIASLVYRSEMAAAIDAAQLRALVQAAQARNSTEAVTGMLVVDGQRFFQWLEGPADAVARIWQSIRRDPRHHQIELLGEHRIPMRLFAQWSMRLAGESQQLAGTVPGAIALPGETLARLREHPRHAPAALANAAQMLRSQQQSSARYAAGILAQTAIARLSKPALASAQAAYTFSAAPVPGGTPEWHPRLLARLCVQRDPQQTWRLIWRHAANLRNFQALVTQILEPAAAALGDLWRIDALGEAQLTLALCRLQALAHQAANQLCPHLPPQRGRQRVLVATAPGELHMLTASLAMECLVQAGWQARIEFPKSDAELAHTLRRRPADVLVLSLSPAMARDALRSRLAHSIDVARHANAKALTVLVGGRAYTDRQAKAAQCNADGHFESAAHVPQLVADAVGGAFEGLNAACGAKLH